MGSSPVFYGTALANSAVLSATAETSYTAPTRTVVIVPAVATAAKIEEIHFVGTGVTVAGVVQTYLYDGTTYRADYAQVVNIVTPSTTIAPYFQAIEIDNLFLPVGWSLVAASFAANQLINVIAFGGFS